MLDRRPLVVRYLATDKHWFEPGILFSLIATPLEIALTLLYVFRDQWGYAIWFLALTCFVCSTNYRTIWGNARSWDRRNRAHEKDRWSNHVDLMYLECLPKSWRIVRQPKTPTSGWRVLGPNDAEVDADVRHVTLLLRNMLREASSIPRP